MKIAVTAVGDNLDAEVDPRFGRSPYFLVIDKNTMAFEALENQNLSLGGGAGIQTARQMVELGVKFVLTGNCGPNAHRTLSAAGIAVVVGCSGSVRKVLEQFKEGKYSTAGEPNVDSHFGIGPGTGLPDDQSTANSRFRSGEDIIKNRSGMGRGRSGAGKQRLEN